MVCFYSFLAVYQRNLGVDSVADLRSCKESDSLPKIKIKYMLNLQLNDAISVYQITLLESKEETDFVYWGMISAQSIIWMSFCSTFLFYPSAIAAGLSWRISAVWIALVYEWPIYNPPPPSLPPPLILVLFQFIETRLHKRYSLWTSTGPSLWQAKSLWLRVKCWIWVIFIPLWINIPCSNLAKWNLVSWKC